MPNCSHSNQLAGRQYLTTNWLWISCNDNELQFYPSMPFIVAYFILFLQIIEYIQKNSPIHECHWVLRNAAMGLSTGQSDWDVEQSIGKGQRCLFLWHAAIGLGSIFAALFQRNSTISTQRSIGNHSRGVSKMESVSQFSSHKSFFFDFLHFNSFWIRFIMHFGYFISRIPDIFRTLHITNFGYRSIFNLIK